MDPMRRAMLDGFAEVLNPDALEAWDRLVPARRWREAIPPAFWVRPDVMAVTDERRRRELHESLVRAVGPEAADATMEYLPPVAWRVLQRLRVDHLLV